MPVSITILSIVHHSYPHSELYTLKEILSEDCSLLPTINLSVHISH